MRFTRHIKATRRPITPLRIKAAERAVQKDKDSVGLFPELANYKSAHERIDAIDEENRLMVQRWRDNAAKTWRRARRNLRQLPEPTRKAITHKWQAGYLPGSASYLADLVWQATRPRP